jgi:hypothetical protein
MYRTSTYSIWIGMRQRCTNPNAPHYGCYGGRGIKVCERWQLYENFLSDMGERPTGLSIDRVNNDGDYEPSNCRWATKQEQVENTRSNRTLTLNGETLTLSAWARRLGWPPVTIHNRLLRGWSVEDALTKPRNPSGTLAPKPCRHCGLLANPLKRMRCHACYEYLRRKGRDRDLKDAQV